MADPINPDDPIPPFGATVSGVASLVPEATLRDGTQPAVEGQYRITYEQVAAWVTEISGAVAMRLDGWQNLPGRTPEDVKPPETTPDRDQLVEYARTVIHNGAASYLEAARHPERAQVNTESYAAVLWARYRDGLADLIAWLAARLGNDGELPGEDGTGGIGFCFPPPLFGDLLRF